MAEPQKRGPHRIGVLDNTADFGRLSPMTITKIISSGTAGAESAALDVAIRLKIPYGGYTLTSAMLDPHPLRRRFKLWEKPFDSPRAKDEANLLSADATLMRPTKISHSFFNLRGL